MAAKKKFSDAEMIAMLNLNDGNISKTAEELGVSRSAIVQRKEALPKGALIQDIAEFKAKRADLFADLQLKAMGQITADKLSKASIQQLSTFIGTMYDKERLENNQSTENVAHKVQQGLSKEDRAYFKELMDKRTQSLIDQVKYDDED